jgi:hypothetical protein
MLTACSSSASARALPASTADTIARSGPDNADDVWERAMARTSTSERTMRRILQVSTHRSSSPSRARLLGSQRAKPLGSIEDLHVADGSRPGSRSAGRPARARWLPSKTLRVSFVYPAARVHPPPRASQRRPGAAPLGLRRHGDHAEVGVLLAGEVVDGGLEKGEPDDAQLPPRSAVRRRWRMFRDEQRGAL